MNLRNYQREARYKCNTLLNAGRNPLYVAPTGAGKTKTAVAIIKDRILLRKRIFILTPQKEIFRQWLKECSEASLEPGYINDEGIVGRMRNVYVCMPQSLSNILHILPESIWPDEIITDEAHHSAANTYENIYNFFDNTLRFGLTATAYRYDNKPLGEYFDDIIQTIDMKEAILYKYLAKPLIIIPEQYKIHVPIKNGDFDPVAQAELLGKQKIIGDMIEKYSLLFQGLPVLIACCTFDHAKHITKKFREAGWIFEHIHSKLPDADRSRMIRQIKSKELNGLCTVGIGIEGLDIPGLYGLIWMRRTMSLSVYLQFTGRVLRSHIGKEYGIILDGVGNTIIHGRPEMPRAWLLYTDYVPHNEEFSGPQMRICPACDVMNSISNISCWICGCIFTEHITKNQKRKFPAMIDGRLVVLEDSEMKHEISQKLNEQRKENINRMEEKKNEKPVQLTKIEKVNILKKNLLDGNKKTLFKEAIQQWM